MAESSEHTLEQPEESKPKSRKWYVRKRDGSVYGPETTELLLEWAAQCRLVSGNEVSEDRKVWVTAERIPELQMCWTAELPDGRTYGPFNVLATHELHKHNVLSADARLTNTITGETTTVGERVDEELRHKQGDMFGTGTSDSPKPKRKRKRSQTSGSTEREGAVAAEESKETQALQAELEALRAQCKTLENQNRSHKEALKGRTNEHKLALAALEEERDALAAELAQLRESSEAALPDGDEEQLADLEEQLKAREEDLQDAQSVLTAREEDLQALEAKLSDTQQEFEIALEATEKRLADESARVAALTEELAEARRQAEDAASHTRTAGDEIGAGEDSETQATIDALTRQIRVLKDDLDKTHLDLEAVREALQAKDEEVHALRVEILDTDPPADERVEELEARLSAIELEASTKEKDLKRERGELREQLGDTEQRLEESREQVLELAEKLKKADASVSSADARQRALRTDLESRFSRTRRELAGAQMALTETRRKLSFFVIAGLISFALAIIFFWLWLGARREHTAVAVNSKGAEAGIEETTDVGDGEKMGGTLPGAGEIEPSGTVVSSPPNAVDIPTAARPRVQVPGVNTQFGATTCTMTFEQPVFTSMATISSAAKTQLKQIADQLRDYMGDFTLTVRGHTDNVPLKGTGLYRDNKALGLARAKAVQAFLVKDGKLPATELEAITAGSDNPPFPNDEAESRRKNRTVVLILVKKK